MEGVWPKMYGYEFHVSSFCQALAEKISNKGWTNSMRLGAGMSFPVFPSEMNLWSSALEMYLTGFMRLDSKVSR